MKPIKRKTSTINFGYTFNQETGLLDAIETELKELEYVENEILKNNMSLRKACEYLKEKTKRHLSAPGLKKHMDKMTDMSVSEKKSHRMKLMGKMRKDPKMTATKAHKLIS